MKRVVTPREWLEVASWLNERIAEMKCDEDFVEEELGKNFLANLKLLHSEIKARGTKPQ